MWGIHLTTLATLLILDYIWLTLNASAYNRMVKSVQGAPLKVGVPGAILSYLCVYLAITFYVFPAVQNAKGGNKLWLSFKYGGFLGFLIYGVFNFTNLAIFKDYDIGMAIRDTLWGVTLFTLTTWVVASIWPRLA